MDEEKTSAYISSQEKTDEDLADDNGDDCFGILSSILQSKKACNAFLMKRKKKYLLKAWNVVWHQDK